MLGHRLTTMAFLGLVSWGCDLSEDDLSQDMADGRSRSDFGVCPATIGFNDAQSFVLLNEDQMIPAPSFGATNFAQTVLPDQSDWDGLVVAETLSASGPGNNGGLAFPNIPACPFDVPASDPGRAISCGIAPSLFRVGSPGEPADDLPGFHNGFWDQHFFASSEVSLLTEWNISNPMNTTDDCVTFCSQTYECDGRGGEQIGGTYLIVTRFQLVDDGGERTDVRIKKIDPNDTVH